MTDYHGNSGGDIYTGRKDTLAGPGSRKIAFKGHARGIRCGAFSLVVALSVVSCAPHKDSRLNVVLIVIDALRFDHVGAERNGVPVMPNLAQLSEQGVWFTRATSSSSWTKPAMASLFTGLAPDVHQVYYSSECTDVDRRHRVMPSRFKLMAEFFFKAGYTTACIQTNPHLTREMGFAQGVEHYEYLPLAPADEVTSAALKAVGDLTEPFCLYVHYIDPHAPFSPPEAYKRLFVGSSILSEEESAMLEPERLDAYLQDKRFFEVGWTKERGYAPLSQAQQERVKDYYAGEARFVDSELGRLLTELRARHSNTLFIVTADHGEELWERGTAGHGTTLYQEVLHVPLLFIGPNLAGRHVEAPVQTLDILPSVAAYLGIEPEALWQGRNFLEGTNPMERPVFASTHGSLTLESVYEEMVAWNGLKLIVNHIKNQNELYDLSSDPLESVNLATAKSQDVATGIALLERERQDNRQKSLPLEGEKAETGETNEETAPETKQQLKALGYL